MAFLLLSIAFLLGATTYGWTLQRIPSGANRAVSTGIPLAHHPLPCHCHGQPPRHSEDPDEVFGTEGHPVCWGISTYEALGW